MKTKRIFTACNMGKFGRSTSNQRKSSKPLSLRQKVIHQQLADLFFTIYAKTEKESNHSLPQLTKKLPKLNDRAVFR